MIFLKLFLTFFKIGLFTFGGGYAMLPLIQEEVLANGWLANEELINFIAVSESTPGPFAINIATYIGNTLGSQHGALWGVFGAFCSTFGVVLPSFIIILIVARFFEKFKDNKIVSGCMTGLKPAVVGLIGAAIISMAQTVFFHNGFSLSNLMTTELFILLAIFLLMLFLTLKKKLHPIIIITSSAILGIASGYALEFIK